MRAAILGKFSGVLLLLAIASATLTGEEKKEDKKANDIVIVITGAGTNAKYIKEGDDSQKPVEVTVGQTVVWQNKGDRKHTATSKMMVDGKPLFDTDQIKKDDSAKILFDQTKYEKAGGKEGGSVTLDYVCANHPNEMMSKIILKAAKK